ncbi:MAG TPA: GspH/FimT family protein [Candidatus Methylomirabilis sp.]|nr:GspH/FimT family protein [Candidatus Methylomirabilis sp.]
MRGSGLFPPGDQRPSKGFTLLEVVVVVLIIVIILGIVSANLEPNRETAVHDEAKRLALLLQTAQQEAILQGKVLAIALEHQGYYFLALDDKGEFKPMDEDEVLRARPLPQDIVISSVDIEGAPESGTPRLIVLPTGEFPPFTITLSRGDLRWQVQGTPAGEIKAENPAAAPGKA